MAKKSPAILQFWILTLYLTVLFSETPASELKVHFFTIYSLTGPSFDVLFPDAALKNLHFLK